MIAEDGEYIITFTDDDIRTAMDDESLTDEDCEDIANELDCLFDSLFSDYFLGRKG